MKCRRSGRRVLFVVAAIAAVTGCASQERAADSQQMQLPPEPAFGAPDTAQRAAVLEYASAVRFVSDPGLTDEQSLLLRGARGPRVRLEAAEHSHLLTRERLARGAFVARFISAGDYAPLGLRRGVHYVFADSSGGSWRSIIVPANAEQPARVMRMALLQAPHLLEGPVARFFEVDGMTFGYFRCGRLCCVPCDPPGYECPLRMFPQLDALNPEALPLRDPRSSTPTP